MINLYIFSNKSRGGLYGVGTYIRELITALRSKSNSIHIHVVHILCDQLQIEKKRSERCFILVFPRADLKRMESSRSRTTKSLLSEYCLSTQKLYSRPKKSSFSFKFIQR